MQATAWILLPRPTDCQLGQAGLAHARQSWGEWLLGTLAVKMAVRACQVDRTVPYAVATGGRDGSTVQLPHNHMHMHTDQVQGPLYCPMKSLLKVSSSITTKRKMARSGNMDLNLNYSGLCIHTHTVSVTCTHITCAPCIRERLTR